MASLGTRDERVIVERNTLQSRGGFPGVQGGDGPAVIEQREPILVRANRIVIIDRRQLVGRCLAASLREADKDTVFEVFPDIESWKRQTPFAAAHVVVLCRPDGNLSETEWAEISRELALLQGEAGAPPVAVISDGENLDQIVRTIKLGVKGYIPTTTSVDIACRRSSSSRPAASTSRRNACSRCSPASRSRRRSRPARTRSSPRASSASPGRCARARRTRSSPTS